MIKGEDLFQNEDASMKFVAERALVCLRNDMRRECKKRRTAASEPEDVHVTDFVFLPVFTLWCLILTNDMSIVHDTNGLARNFEKAVSDSI